VYNGKGYVIATTPHQATLFDKGFITLHKDFQIKKLHPILTDHLYQVKTLAVDHITLDSLREEIYDKPIISLHLHSENPICYRQIDQISSSKQVELHYVYNPSLYWDPSSKEQSQSIHLLEAKLHTLQREQSQRQERIQQIESQVKEIQQSISSLTYYQREKATQHVRELQKELKKERNNPSANLLQEKIDQAMLTIKQLKEQPPLTCSGYIKYLLLPKREENNSL
jgi:DNA repair exonuclease SbcCD ATPase subunit